jgi:hypothetical protein
VKINKPGGKFEMKTPNAVIGVIGTDFYVGFESNTTTVICYKGKVSVTPTNGAHTGNNSGQSNAASNSVTVSAGQMVVVTSEIPPAGFQPSDTPPATLQASLTDTDIPTNAGDVHTGHTLRWVVIGTAVAVGLGVGLGVGLTRGGGGTTKPGAPVTGAP